MRLARITTGPSQQMARNRCQSVVAIMTVAMTTCMELATILNRPQTLTSRMLSTSPVQRLMMRPSCVRS